METLGFIIGFQFTVLSSIPFTLLRYRSQIMRMVSEMAWGRGRVIDGGGVLPMMVVLGIGVGGTVAMESFAALDSLGLAPITGSVSAFAVTRELAPIAAAIGFAVQAGCRITAQVGAMRISEEIDALEALGLRSIPFVVTTRVIAGAVVVVPALLAGLVLAYLSCRAWITVVHDEPVGVYNHYFLAFVSSGDMLAAVLKAALFAVAVIVIHSYYGYCATGGPEGVGLASGRAVRASTVAIVVLDMIVTLAFSGAPHTVTVVE
ncbi:ABC transporter permease [Nocardia sp. NPDC056064]|uniref:ABC transporter permease n=1 Tax=Nocardia sp. NPDC056064 TaxID=3345701 RepID=UPI0035E00222